jgi:hypothetical protein
MDDNGMLGISMRGGAGDDMFWITGNAFHDIDGGSNSAAGRDVIEYMVGGGTLDFSAVGSEQISHIEELMSSGTSQTISLTINDLFNLANSSDNGEFYITAFDSTTHLVLDSEGTESADPDIIQSEFADIVGGSYLGTSGGYEQFEVGGLQLNIDTVLFTNSQIELTGV